MTNLHVFDKMTCLDQLEVVEDHNWLAADVHREYVPVPEPIGNLKGTVA